MRARLAALAFLGLGVVAAGAAATPAAPSIAGAWRFQTGVFDADCRISGDMAIIPDGAGRYRCTFTANQVCPGARVNIIARQTCQVTQSGANVVMTATLVEVKPATSYAPDNWVLTIVNPSQMKGELRSADNATAVFYRAEAVVS